MSRYESLWNHLNNCNETSVTLTFDKIGGITGAPIDHSFLRYKKELTAYGWQVKKISLKEQKVIFEKC